MEAWKPEGASPRKLSGRLPQGRFHQFSQEELQLRQQSVTENRKMIITNQSINKGKCQASSDKTGTLNKVKAASYQQSCTILMNLYLRL